MRIGVMGAMAEEVDRLWRHMSDPNRETRGMREYVTGRLRGKHVTVVFSRWGKVAASSTATTLIERFGVDGLVFTGVAGALDPALNIGDVVVADTLVQYDMDASILPGMEKYEIPLLGVSRFRIEPRYVAAAHRAAAAYLAEGLRDDVAAETLAEFRIAEPRVAIGTIGSADRFISDERIAQGLREGLPDLKCVEMEGAAVAQVAYEHGIPCIVLRAISDKADHGAIVDFPQFVRKIASHITCGSVLRLLDIMEA